MGEAKRKKNKGFSLGLSKAKLTTFIVIFSILAIVTYDFQNRSVNSPIKKFDPARSKGSYDARVKIVEFIDMQCPECKRGSNIIMKYMQESPGEVFLALKYFPLGALNSTISSVYSECAAGQGKFWEFHELLVERQNQWRTIRNVKPLFKIIAKDAGLDLNLLDSCVEDPKIYKIVRDDQHLGESYFVRSTPTYFINDEMYVGVEEMQKKLRRELGPLFEEIE